MSTEELKKELRKYPKISVERAIEILDPTHRERYRDLTDSMEQVSQACQMGMDALRTIHPLDANPPEYIPTHADALIQVLADVVANGADEDGYPNVEYEELVVLTQYIGCPYTHQPLCALDEKNKDNPEAYIDCDACKAHWLMKKWEG